MAIVVVLAVVLGVAWWVWRASNVLWTIDVVDGQVTHVRGQPPIGFLNAVREIVARPPAPWARLVARRAEQGAVLTVRGLDEGRCQRLQNVFRLEPQATLRSGPSPVNRENLRWAVGLAWLLSLFRR